MDNIDEVGGLPARHAGKLLSPNPVKSLGRSSLGPLLGTLGVKLIVAVDEAALEKIRYRLTPSEWPANRGVAQRDKLMKAAAAVGQDTDAQRRALMSELGRQSHATRVSFMTPEDRRR